MNKFLAILMKEWMELLRSRGVLFFIFYILVINIYIAGEGINLDARGVNVGIIDEKGCSVYVNKIVTSLHPPEFKEILYYSSRTQMYEDIKNKKIVAGLVFPSTFDQDIVIGKETKIQLLLDTTVATLSYYTYTHLVNIVNSFQTTVQMKVPVELDVHKLYNPNASSVPFITLKELVSAITLLSIILTASVFVREKEQDTWNLMLLVPVNPYVMILAKLLSQVFVVMIGFILSLGLVLFGLFDLPMAGSFWALFFMTFLYAVATSGIGLFIASVAKNITHVGLMTIMAIIPLTFLSGGTSSIYTKGEIVQWFSYLSPLRYYTEGVYNLVFRGTEVIYLWEQFLGITVIAIVLIVYSVKKIGKLF